MTRRWLPAGSILFAGLALLLAWIGERQVSSVLYVHLTWLCLLLSLGLGLAAFRRRP